MTRDLDLDSARTLQPMEGNNYVELLQNINAILILIGMKHLYQTRQQAMTE